MSLITTVHLLRILLGKKKKKNKKNLEESLNKAGTQTDICVPCSQRIIHIRQKLGTPQVSKDR